MSEYNTHAGNLRLIGGRLCLDFVNTANNHSRADMKEHLVDYAALIAWAQHAKLLGSADARQLAAEARGRPAAAADALRHARELRNALYQLFSTVAAGQQIAPTDLAPFNAALVRLPQPAQLAATLGGPDWNWGAVDHLERAIWPVIWSAAELLTSPKRALVRECAGHECTWLFLDTSRNRSRRWCSMEDCGNRAKAQRHYVRYRRWAGDE
jgi:predicted RNA-binding Zn ribbon-like protein